MTRVVPGAGAVIEPVFNSTYGIRDVYVVNGGSGYVQSDPPELKKSQIAEHLSDQQS